MLTTGLEAGYILSQAILMRRVIHHCISITCDSMAFYSLMKFYKRKNDTDKGINYKTDQDPLQSYQNKIDGFFRDAFACLGLFDYTFYRQHAI